MVHSPVPHAPPVTPAALQPSPFAPRQRALLVAGIVATIALGLASRRWPGVLFPSALGKYPGDALWALMVMFGWACVWPRMAPLRLAALALATSFAVEFSQLYQAPWINAIRSTTPGHLVLGSWFGAMDLVAYAVGVACGLGLDGLRLAWLRKRKSHAALSQDTRQRDIG
ncbi:DUF2809 domain-containing protein [Paracidovorax valerianellae]|uniref:DUF2809 domain-containing protein n=1 Tax=Paracidovorax valerianellae TaxID=187868 RepID=A0A1G6M7L5_9BURK|nr:DUF2809 domain-containing protein [Paracidovorax valerianellae]MDA8446070.1 DUF2809 domain-containing protein [Paracidovorax valerianellae]SDC51450.1 Protein of unknown function [Paracidovorax valerianellae]